MNNLVGSVRFTGGIGVVGIFLPKDPGGADQLAKQGEIAFDMGLFWFKGQSIGTGQANIKHYNRHLRNLIHAGRAKPSWIISHRLPLDQAPNAYQHFDARDSGWTKVVLKPAASFWGLLKVGVKAAPTSLGEAMEQRYFGSTRRQVAVIGQGTWYDENEDPASAIAALRLGLDRGMKHIDTAEMYGSGAAEKLVGQAIGGRRDEVFLVSKVLPQNAGRRTTIKACEKSLLRLKTNRLDCYLLHWRGRHPLEETVAAFEQLCDEGKILSWGVSNFDVDDLEEVWSIAGEGRLACNQVLYHLQERAIEHAVIPWCQKHKVAVVGYSPLGHGAFPAPHSPGERVLHEIAELQHATPRQVALQFLVRCPGLFTIPKASTPEHAAENAGAGDFQLSAADVAGIDKAFPLGPRPATLPML